MKSIEEIQEMLISEFNCYFDIINSNIKLDYYNEVLGDTSFLLAGLLSALLKKNQYGNWTHRWTDDTLLIDVKIYNKKLSIAGILIWGKMDTTEQWTDPFYFEAHLNLIDGSFKQYFFLLGDMEQPEVTYDYFNQHRDFWNNNLSNRKWRYTILAPIGPAGRSLPTTSS